MSSNGLDISKYLMYLVDVGWSVLIDDRWKDEVYNELIAHFPAMTSEEWNQIESVIFV